MNNVTVKIMICVFIMLMFASCASIETKSEARQKDIPGDSGVDVSGPSLKAMEGIKKVSVLADICVAEHMNALLLDESVSADHYTLTGIQAFLKKNGIVPILCPAPYVGSYITVETGGDVKTDSGIENKKPPFALPSLSNNDKEYNEALMKVLASVAVLPTEKKERNASFKPDMNLSECLSVITDKTGSDAILVVIGQALVYIRDKNNRIIDNGSGTTFHKASPDSIQIIDLRKDEIEGLAVLIDLKSKTVIWSNATRLNLPETGRDYKTFFRDGFVGTMLREIPFK